MAETTTPFDYQQIFDWLATPSKAGAEYGTETPKQQTYPGLFNVLDKATGGGTGIGPSPAARPVPQAAPAVAGSSSAGGMFQGLLERLGNAAGLDDSNAVIDSMAVRAGARPSVAGRVPATQGGGGGSVVASPAVGGQSPSMPQAAPGVGGGATIPAALSAPVTGRVEPKYAAPGAPRPAAVAANIPALPEVPNTFVNPALNEQIASTQSDLMKLKAPTKEDIVIPGEAPGSNRKLDALMGAAGVLAKALASLSGNKDIQGVAAGVDDYAQGVIMRPHLDALSQGKIYAEGPAGLRLDTQKEFTQERAKAGAQAIQDRMNDVMLKEKALSTTLQSLQSQQQLGVQDASAVFHAKTQTVQTAIAREQLAGTLEHQRDMLSLERAKMAVQQGQFSEQQYTQRLSLAVQTNRAEAAALKAQMKDASDSLMQAKVDPKSAEYTAAVLNMKYLQERTKQLDQNFDELNRMTLPSGGMNQKPVAQNPVAPYKP